MLAASRFEGGSWVRLGFLITYAAFAYGCVVIGSALVRARRTRLDPSPLGLLTTLLAGMAVAALALPAVEFPGETLSGFRGLDLLSVVSAVALGAVVAVGQKRVLAALCLSGVLGGNLVIQHFTTRGSTDRYGLLLATVAALASLLCSLLRVRGAGGARK